MKYRQYHPDELTDDQKERMCPACRMRYKFPPPAGNDSFNPISLQAGQIRWLENAARVFDQESDMLFTAAEFVAWMKPDLAGRPRIDVGVPVMGRPVEYDDPDHIKDREYRRELRRRKKDAA